MVGDVFETFSQLCQIFSLLWNKRKNSMFSISLRKYSNVMLGQKWQMANHNLLMNLFSWKWYLSAQNTDISQQIHFNLLINNISIPFKIRIYQKILFLNLFGSLFRSFSASYPNNSYKNVKQFMLMQQNRI